MFHKTMAILAMVVTLPLFAEAQVKPKITKPEAEQAALAAVKGGKILSGEYEKENGKHIWSFDVRANGSIKEIWIDPVSGKVIKVQNESVGQETKENAGDANGNMEHGSSHSKKFASQSKITKSQAEKIAMKAVPGGKVTEAELEHESEMFIWSLDVKKGNQTNEVWISPRTGKVLKVSVENEKNEGHGKD